jgi:nucleoside-diphosphate-sugar epimerase
VASYLVTGGAGFIGSHLAVELLRRGQRVRIADNLITGNLSNLAEARSAQFLEGDLAEADVADISKAAAVLGYAPTVSLTDGLKLTLDWFRAARHDHARAF